MLARTPRLDNHNALNVQIVFLAQDAGVKSTCGEPEFFAESLP